MATKKRKHSTPAPAKPRKRKKRKAAKRKRSSAPKRKRARAPKRKRSSSPRRSGGSGFAFEVERVKLTRQGYDTGGRYWGANTAGQRLFYVRVTNKANGEWSDSHVRAATKREARTKVQGQMLNGVQLESGGDVRVSKKAHVAPHNPRAARAPKQHFGGSMFAHHQSQPQPTLMCPNGHGRDLYYNHSDDRMHCAQCGAGAVAAAR